MVIQDLCLYQDLLIISAFEYEFIIAKWYYVIDRCPSWCKTDWFNEHTSTWKVSDLRITCAAAIKIRNVLTKFKNTQIKNWRLEYVLDTYFIRNKEQVGGLIYDNQADEHYRKWQKVTVELKWWLLKPWCIFGASVSATTMVTFIGRHILGVSDPT